MIPAEVVDRAPATDEERGTIMGFHLDQLRELRDVIEREVTCSCGDKTTIGLAARCAWCGLWFCRRCSERHFGKAPA